jgi:hypothetical protein
VKYGAILRVLEVGIIMNQVLMLVSCFDSGGTGTKGQRVKQDERAKRQRGNSFIGNHWVLCWCGWWCGLTVPLRQKSK